MIYLWSRLCLYLPQPAFQSSLLFFFLLFSNRFSLFLFRFFFSYQSGTTASIQLLCGLGPRAAPSMAGGPCRWPFLVLACHAPVDEAMPTAANAWYCATLGVVAPAVHEDDMDVQGRPVHMCGGALTSGGAFTVTSVCRGLGGCWAESHLHSLFITLLASPAVTNLALFSSIGRPSVCMVPSIRRGCLSWSRGEQWCTRACDCSRWRPTLRGSGRGIKCCVFATLLGLAYAYRPLK